jgi:hypothetical protein
MDTEIQVGPTGRALLPLTVTKPPVLAEPRAQGA